ncbi:hypothetical protein HDIA_1753 [Hartmannibacter diazotrophicus]|uniref:Uncharacterized protein n=1 Tax=Hartmannibacter diazotrophicus TaxID=1482074 RepID=A0A2C9D4R6_9HYPH|nr:hypothetical protein [Hartmannibacter diazotrophicus]SON55294.1 hypothetical protein HDIA_1753 [Hartmannibacter diazotrophicus]
MKAFLASVVVLLVVAVGASYVLNGTLETSSASAYSSSNVRLN